MMVGRQLTADFHDFLRTRRSIRRFKPDPVPAEALERVLQTAAFAPSAHNDQPWRFAVLTSAENKSLLSETLAADFHRDLQMDGLPEADMQARLERSRRRINEAPVVIILCMDTSGMDDYPDAKRQQAEKTMAVQSVALAGLQLMLAAHAEGLGSVWTCGPLFAPKVVHSALNLPAAWQPQAMIFMGYPDETPKPKELKTISELAWFF